MTALRPLANPPNPWATSEVEYLEGEAPSAKLEVYEDHTRGILAHNDSPDVGFDWSVNPYRGCFHACAYCLSGDTRVLMADGLTRALRDVRAGDRVVGTRLDGDERSLVPTPVLAHWASVKPALRVALDDGTALVASAEHRFLTARGWRHVAEVGPRRPHLVPGDRILGGGALTQAPADTPAYRRGYVCGVVRGDALFPEVRSARSRRARARLRSPQLAATVGAVGGPSGEPRGRAREYLGDVGLAGVRALSEWPDEAPVDWCRGFLAGLFDAEGSYDGASLRVSGHDERTLLETVRCLGRLGFDGVLERGERSCAVSLGGGAGEHVRFFRATGAVVGGGRAFQGHVLRAEASPRVVAVEPLRASLPMFDVTTGTGDFIAEGVVAHNCYARPSHEYLSFGAGTDFDRKIVVKPRAAELLREAFDDPKWKGDNVVFSGVTDCYQPLEASYRITRACLEVCAEYRNPCGVISKSALVERDIDVMQELTRTARFSIMVSVPFWDEGKARAIEPFVTTPARRVRAIERLARAGITVGVMVAPIIPGLNDEDMPDVLKAAREAGATRAGTVLLRLPGPVKDVFEERVRAAMPLRADRIIRRIKETRGGKMYDARYGVRGTGEGVYAETIARLFEQTCAKLGLNAQERYAHAGPTTFRRPRGQIALF